MIKITEAEQKFIHFQQGVAGSFLESLFRCIFAADVFNQAKIAKGFPEFVEVVQRYQNEPGYWEDLQNRWELHVASQN